MLSQTGHLPESRLRAVTQRLALTPNKRLPQIVPFLADSITGCCEILSTSDGQRQGKDGAELGVLIHKLKTQLSALLLEKSVDARWSAVVLIKATIEVGGWEILQGSGAWTRGLLGILNKPDSAATKRLCIITLTRIFLLTQGRQSLLREITTPSIPPFVTSCLNLVSLRRSAQEPRKPDLISPLLDTVLQALIRLIPHHPSSFRPFVSQIRSLLAPLLAPTPCNLPPETGEEAESSSGPRPVVVLAQKLYALLPQCAPKNTSNEEWTKSIKDTLKGIHRTADRVFRAVSKEWSSLARTPVNQPQAETYGDVLSDGVDESIGLPGWRGIEAGCERLVGLLQLLESHIATESSSMYTLPAGAILSTMERLLSITVPSTSGHQKSGDHARLNPEVGREEREGMWLNLPQIHIAATAVLTTLMKRLDAVSIASTQGVLEQLLWVFQREKGYPELRRSVYEAVVEILAIVGPSMPQSTVSAMSPLIRALCQDALPESNMFEMTSMPSPNGAKKPPNNSAAATNADSYLQPQGITPTTPEPVPAVREVAAILLPLILSRIPQAHVSVPVRSLLDRTAILTKNENAMLTSVLNPPERPKGKQIRSILPLYARSSALSLGIEGLLRPRMPGLQQDRTVSGTMDAEAEDVDMTSSFADYQRGADDIMSGTDAVRPQGETHIADNHGTLASDGRTLAQMMNLDAEMKPSVSLNMGSPKRTRATEESAMAIGESTLDSSLPASKRVRSDQQTAYVHNETASSEPLPEKTPITTEQTFTMQQSIAVSEDIASASHDAAGGNESDDSFEIPPIILDSSSEEGEEDEEK